MEKEKSRKDRSLRHKEKGGLQLIRRGETTPRHSSLGNQRPARREGGACWAGKREKKKRGRVNSKTCRKEQSRGSISKEGDRAQPLGLEGESGYRAGGGKPSAKPAAKFAGHTDMQNN